MHTGELQRDYSLLTTAVESTRKRHKTPKTWENFCLGGSSNCGLISTHRADNVQKSDDQRSDFTGKCCAAHTCQSYNWSRHLISGLISFSASHLISGRRCPSLYSQELIPPPFSLLLCDGVSVTGCIAGLYALIIWHPPFRCAIKVPLLSSFLLCWQNNVQ